MSPTRLETIMALPEATGRRSLAKHLAEKTALPLPEVRKTLAAGHADPVAMAQEVLDAHRANAGGKPLPGHVDASVEEAEAEKLAGEITALRRAGRPSAKVAKAGAPPNTDNPDEIAAGIVALHRAGRRRGEG